MYTRKLEMCPGVQPDGSYLRNLVKNEPTDVVNRLVEDLKGTTKYYDGYLERLVP